MSLSLYGCQGFGSAIPSLGNSNSSNDAAQVMPKTSLAVGKEASSYQGSIHDEISTSTDTNNDAESATGSKNVLGVLKDKSRNKNISKTDTNNGSTDNDKISGNQYNNINEVQLLIIVIGLIVTCLLAGIVFGKFIPTRRQNKTYDKAIEYLFRGCDK